MRMISEKEFNKLIITDKLDSKTWEVWFDATIAGYVVKDKKTYRALSLQRRVIAESSKLLDAKQFCAMEKAAKMGLEVSWNYKE